MLAHDQQTLGSWKNNMEINRACEEIIASYMNQLYEQTTVSPKKQSFVCKIPVFFEEVSIGRIGPAMRILRWQTGRLAGP